VVAWHRFVGCVLLDEGVGLGAVLVAVSLGESARLAEQVGGKLPTQQIMLLVRRQGNVKDEGPFDPGVHSLA
jgi:hypothetical protein